MPQILHTTLHPGRPVLAAGEIIQFDLPVNPLSVILLTFIALNETAAIATYSAIAAFFAKYTNLNVRYRGATIINGRSDDLAVAMALRPQRWVYGMGQTNETDNNVRAITIPLLFGRKAYDPMECFPATRRGDLILELTAAADGAGLDNHILQVETIELLDANPERFIKITETQQAMAAAGANTIDLPIGNKLMGVLMRPFAFPTAALQTSSFGEVSFELDNVEVSYSHINWESLHGSLSRRLPPWWTGLEHIHSLDATVAGREDTLLGQADFALAQQYGYLDFDPLDDNQYMIDTRGAADIGLQIQSDTADAANLSRVYPIEVVETGAGAGSPSP